MQTSIENYWNFTEIKLGKFSWKSTQNQNLFKENPKNSMEKMQKLNLRMQKLNFQGTHWRGLALIGAQKNPLSDYMSHFRKFAQIF